MLVWLLKKAVLAFLEALRFEELTFVAAEFAEQEGCQGSASSGAKKRGYESHNR